MTVIIRTTQLLVNSGRNMRERKKRKYLNAVLILNLSISDLLVAVSILVEVVIKVSLTFTSSFSSIFSSSAAKVYL